MTKKKKKLKKTVFGEGVEPTHSGFMRVLARLWQSASFFLFFSFFTVCFFFFLHFILTEKQKIFFFCNSNRPQICTKVFLALVARQWHDGSYGFISCHPIGLQTQFYTERSPVRSHLARQRGSMRTLWVTHHKGSSAQRMMASWLTLTPGLLSWPPTHDLHLWPWPVLLHPTSSTHGSHTLQPQQWPRETNSWLELVGGAPQSKLCHWFHVLLILKSSRELRLENARSFWDQQSEFFTGTFWFTALLWCPENVSVRTALVVVVNE